MTRETGPSRPSPASANVSDDEDLYSPSDGYFSNSSHVPSNVLILDSEPSQSQSQTSSKASEAESESQSPTSYRHSEPERSGPARNGSVIYTPSSSRQSETGLTESSPLLEGPPPLYEDAIAGRPRQLDIRASRTMGYGTTINHNDVGNASFIAGQPRAPQSMADHPRNGPMGSSPHDEESDSLEQPNRTRRGCFGRKKRRDLNSELYPKRQRSLFKRAFIFLAGFLCIVWFLGLLWSNLHAHPNTEHRGHSQPAPPKSYDPEDPIVSPSPTIPTPPTSPEPSQPSTPLEPSLAPSKPSLAPSKSSLAPSKSSSAPSEPPSASAAPSPTPKNPYIDPPEKVFPPRSIHVRETSQSVSGTYPLYDLLDITTTSGSVSIYIDPQPAPDYAPNTTAELRISTKSGSVSILGVGGVHRHASESPWSRWWNWGFNPPPEASSTYSDGVPSRPYKITISTASGAVSGFLIHGQDTSITTGSGSISMNFYPVYFGEDNSSTLNTVTGSGSTNIEFLRSYEQAKLDTLDSRHESRGSGSINVIYPELWEGEVDISSKGSGSITAYGTGLDVIRYGHGHVVGSKGNGSSKAELYTKGSGSQVFYVK